MDSESLPTGIAIASSRHSALTACHRVVQPLVLARAPAAAIQLADSRTSATSANRGGRHVGQRLAHREAARGRRVEQRHRRALAHRHGLAGEGLEAERGHAHVAHRHLPRARRAGPGPPGRRRCGRRCGSGRTCRPRPAGAARAGTPRAVRCRRGPAGQRRRRRDAHPRTICGGLPSRVSSGMSTGVSPSSAVGDDEPAACHRGVPSTA